MSELGNRARDAHSLWYDNPVLHHLFGLTPLLALSTTLVLGTVMLLATTVLLLAASIISWLLLARINANWRFVFHLGLLAVLSSLLAAALGTWNPALVDRLGLYLPLLACSFIPLLHLQSQSPQQSLGQRLIDALRLAGGYGLAVVVLSALRESLIFGRLLSDWALLTTGSDAATENPLLPFAATPAAGFLLLAMLVAAIAWLQQTLRSQRSITAPDPAPRARVTEKLQ